MKLVTGDLWSYPATWIGITTNGTVKKNGDNVLGSGCAGQFRERYPTAETEVGKLIAAGGNHVYLLSDWKIFTFPTKHNWFDEQSDMELIIRSAHELTEKISYFSGPDTFLLPRPGVGAGRLRWEDVKKAIEPILPDEVLVITWH